MVDFIKRDKSDILNKKILGFLFKNQKFLLALRVVVFGLFFYAIFLGFSDTSKNNLFTFALFWGMFWSFFMVATLPTFGRIFCGICPHGFLGKYITKFGLKKSMPEWMQNRFIGLLLLVVGWWGVYYIYPGVYRTPLGTAMLFTVMSVLAFLLYFLYKDMSYCKYICPIGTVTRAFSKLSFARLGTYKSACRECKTFDCATACPYNLKPFTFDKKNSMEDCTLCMECTSACESVNFKFKKPSSSLFGKFKALKVEIWAYILILASIPIAMAFHHGIDRSKAAKDMIWYKSAEIFKPLFGRDVDTVGLFAYLYAMVFTILAATVGMYIASKILKKPFKDVFYNLGYSYAPLFIFASLGYALSGFFTRGYKRIVEGFAWAFGFSMKVAPLAKRGDDWLMIFNIFKWVAIIWALVILYKRFKLIKADKLRKIVAFPFAAMLIIFYFGVNQYRAHITSTYARASGGMHGSRAKRGKMHHAGGKSKVAAIVVKPKDTLFFTDRNPTAKRKGGMGMMYMNRAKEGVQTRTFWLVSRRLARPKCVKNADGIFYLLNVDGVLSDAKIGDDRGCANITFKVPKSGYYTLYYVKNNKRFINVAKYEYKRFDHGGDEIFSKDKISSKTTKEVGFDILRLRDNEDSFYYRLHSGDEVRFKVLKDGKPLEGAKVSFKTQFGWQKSARSGGDGIVKFQLIKDYNPKWDKFNKRFKEKFLVVATYKDKNISYKVSYNDIYIPSKEAYQSFAYALIVAMLLLIFISAGVFMYRYKVQKPFREVTFDE
ncbi:MAG: 4Fe-4S binding protein [Sulfurospirillum sp.]